MSTTPGAFHPWYGSEIAGDFGGNTPVPPASLVPNKLRPSILTTFYGFHAMFFGWLLMLLVAIAGVALRLRGRLFAARWFHRLLVAIIPIGIVAIWGGGCWPRPAASRGSSTASCRPRRRYRT